MYNMMNFTKQNVIKWMRENKEDFVDSQTNEFDLTGIVEAAAKFFDEDYEDGPLDDETHWIWECPFEL